MRKFIEKIKSFFKRKRDKWFLFIDEDGDFNIKKKE